MRNSKKVKRNRAQALTHFFIRGDKHPFPRRAHRKSPKRLDYTVETVEDLETFCRYGQDVYVSLFSEDQQRSRTYDMVLLDVDRNNLEVAYRDAVSIMLTMWGAGCSTLSVVFSGQKGFHIYLPIPPTRLNNYRVAVLGALAELGVLDYVDQVAIGPSRLFRVPYTHNEDAYLCRPISAKVMCDSFNAFWVAAMSDVCFPLESMEPPNTEMEKILLRHDGDIELGADEVTIQSGKSKVFDKLEHYPPCMERLIKAAAVGTDLPHNERLEMAKFLLLLGGSVEDIAPYYSRMSDYKEGVTKYQIEYAKSRNLKMSNCKSLLYQGMCPFADADVAQQNCPIFPSINYVLMLEAEGEI